MENDVAAACLRTNYRQSLAISLAERRSIADVASFGRVIHYLELAGGLDRKLEALPSDAEIHQRAGRGCGLARPEIAVVLSQAKIVLKNEILSGELPIPRAAERLLVAAFPSALERVAAEEIERHPLGREIIATSWANGIIDHCGPELLLLLDRSTGVRAFNLVEAYTAACAIFDLPRLWGRIDEHDLAVPGAVQLEAYLSLQRRLRELVEVLIDDRERLSKAVEAVTEPSCNVRVLATAICAEPPVLPPDISRLAEEGVAIDLVEGLARLERLLHLPHILALASETALSPAETAKVFFGVGEEFGLTRLRKQARAFVPADEFERRAVHAAMETIDSAHHALTLQGIVRSGHGRTLGFRTKGIIDTLAGTSGSQTLTLSHLALAAMQISKFVYRGPIRELGAAA